MDALQLQVNDRDGCILKFDAKQRDDARTIELLREKLATMGNSRSVTVTGTIASQNQPEGRGTNMDSNFDFVEQPDDMDTIEACDEKSHIDVGRKSIKNPLLVDAVQVTVPSQGFTEQLPA